jgi:ArsR family transcriptional regulator, arsenate/arsenite/antimonite-responsive transcriptional repressor
MSPEKFFHALADETRLRCVVLIQQMGELCVCELTDALKLSQPKISRHLATLKAINVLRARREGLWIYYDLHPNLPAWAITVLQETVVGIQKKVPFCTDKKNLTKMSNRKGSQLCLN